MRVAGSSRPANQSENFDVIVIGGGINGVAIARECAQAGKRTLLLEQNDFGSGTSSRTTRIIHGGLRYLEHGELGLVHESLRERERLLQQHPHLVRPISFVLALPQDGDKLSSRSAMAVRAGLWLYRKMGGSGDHSCASQGNDVAAIRRSLDKDVQWAVFNYEDAQCEFPERLIAEWLTDATSAGAVALNHTEVLAIEVENGHARAVVARDRSTLRETKYQSCWIINATGPWADRVCRGSGIETARMIGGVRGAHLLLPRFPGAPNSAVYSEASDGRAVFVLPWNGQVMVGSTEVTDDRAPDGVKAEPWELHYLFQAFTRLFPASGLSMADIRSSYSGVRPLPYSPEKNASAITRRHSLREHSDDGAAGLISIIGGKLTTAASVGRECARLIGINVAEPALSVVARGRTSGFDNSLDQWSRQIANEKGPAGTAVSVDSARVIATWFGRNALEIVRCARHNQKSAQPICEHSTHLVAEALYAAHREQAVTLGDILLRRVPVALGACWSEQCSRTAALRIGEALGWSSWQTEFNLEDFEIERKQFLRKPSAGDQSEVRNVPASQPRAGAHPADIVGSSMRPTLANN